MFFFPSNCLQSYLLFKLDRIKKLNFLRNPSATQSQTEPGDEFTFQSIFKSANISTVASRL